MTSYKDILSQIDELTRQAEAQRKKEIATVVVEIKQKMADYGITAEDLGFSSRGRGRVAKAKGVAKYRDPASGRTWSGKGRKPNWLNEALKQGKQLQSFAI